MSSANEKDWENYFETYVRKNPDMHFTQIAEQIAKKLGIELDEVISGEGSDIIDYIWDTGSDDLPATTLIGKFTENYQLTFKELLLHPAHKEVINALYQERVFEEDEFSSNPSLYTSNSESLKVATDQPNTTTRFPSQRNAHPTFPTGHSTSKTIQSNPPPGSNSRTDSRTKAGRVAVFVEIPALIAAIMVDSRWRIVRDGINAITKQIAGRLGQTQFRQALFDNYGCRCLVTGYSVPHVIEAAHIRPYKSKGGFNVENGLLLRSDLHMLFDQNLLTFHPRTFKVELNSRLKETEYKSLAEQTLQVNNAKIKPNEDALQERYDAFLKAKETTDYSYAEPPK